MDRLDLGKNSKVALAVALRADHADRWLMNKIRIGTEFTSDRNGLGRASGMVVDEQDICVFHEGSFQRRALRRRQAVTDCKDLWRQAAAQGKRWILFRLSRRPPGHDRCASTERQLLQPTCTQQPHKAAIRWQWRSRSIRTLMSRKQVGVNPNAHHTGAG